MKLLVITSLIGVTRVGPVVAGALYAESRTQQAAPWTEEELKRLVEMCQIYNSLKPDDPDDCAASDKSRRASMANQ